MAEPAVIQRLYDLHAPGVRRYLARLVGEAEAEDLAHDVFEKAQRALHTHRAEARLSTWLYRIATHSAIDRLRSRAARQREVARLHSAPPEGPAEGPRPDREIDRLETRACVLDHIGRLPPSEKAAILLADLGGLTDRGTAEALGVSVGAVKIRLHRARRRLRKLLERSCRVYRDERNELGCEPIGLAGPVQLQR